MNNKGLGRGLEALFGAFDEQNDYENITKAKRDNGVTEVEIGKVRPNPNQPRKNFDTEALNELASSIKTHGIIQPIVVNNEGNGNYRIIAGERRWRAANLCGLKTVPVIIKNYTDKQVKEISIIENLQREDLNPIEAARAIKELMDEYGLTQETVSERIGKSRSNIANTLRLLSLYPDVIKMVEEGKLSSGHARCLVVIEDQNDQIKMAQVAV
ncbi:MAG: ParB/RepB/Spo0J family partition protein, partial [Clostridia bacterium]|nr:ParB/RepB/Spo0J family partition protein [Clostridia bacterium]